MWRARWRRFSGCRSFLEIDSHRRQTRGTLKDKIETILDGGFGSASHAESSSTSGGRKHSAALRVFQKCLVEDPKYICDWKQTSNQIFSLDLFILAKLWLQEPQPGGGLLRGVASKTFPHMELGSGRDLGSSDGQQDRGSESPRRAFACSSRASSIDRGSWVVSSIALLERPPPFQSFSSHLPPSPLKLQRSVLYDPR